MSTASQTETAGAERKLPLFFREPAILSTSRHKHWRLQDGDYAFAADAVSVPVSVSEFVAAIRDYPVLFAAQTAAPIALLGLKDKNLSVTNGEWREDLYIPAYVRRYPFGAVSLKQDEAPVLMIDTASERLLQDEAEEAEKTVPLFEEDKPSAYTQRMLSFCDHFHQDALTTEAFSKALLDADLLVERRADVTLPGGGEKLGVSGFRVVDPKRFADLPDETVTEWHRKGWLGLVHLHLASLDRFQDLMRRQSSHA